MSLDRKDYKSAIPQLEKRISAVENSTVKGLKGFDILKDALDAERLARQKAVLKVDEGIDLVTVKMFYALVDPATYVGNIPPPSTVWSETMPTIDETSAGLVLWYKSKTLRNGVVVNESAPQTIQIMNGVFSFINNVSPTDPNTHLPDWTTIDGGTISTGVITASGEGESFFNLVDGSFKVWSTQTQQGLWWDGERLNIVGSITLTGHSDTVADEISAASKVADDYIKLDGNGIKVSKQDDANHYITLNSSGLKVFNSGSNVAEFGSTARVGTTGGKNVKIGSTGITINDGSTSLAEYGSTVRIGKSTEENVGISSSGITLNDGSTNLATFKAGTVASYSSDPGTRIESTTPIGFYPSGGTNGIVMKSVGGSPLIFHYAALCPQPLVYAKSTNANISLSANTVTKVPMTSFDVESLNDLPLFSIDSGNVTIDEFDGFVAEVTASACVAPSSNAYVNLYIYRFDSATETATEIAQGSAYILASYNGVVQISPRLTPPLFAGDYLYMSVRVVSTSGTLYCNNKDTRLMVKYM